MVRIVNGEIVKDDPLLPTVNPSANQPESVQPQQTVQYQRPQVEVFGRKINPIWLSVSFFIFTLIFGLKGNHDYKSVLRYRNVVFTIWLWGVYAL
jgi:hypothetical protein